MPTDAMEFNFDGRAPSDAFYEDGISRSHYELAAVVFPGIKFR
jgi:hypothetical protein